MCFPAFDSLVFAFVLFDWCIFGYLGLSGVAAFAVVMVSVV